MATHHPDEVIGLRPVRMKPLLTAMILGYGQETGVRIFPHQKTAILIPVTKAEKDRDGLVRVGDTNTYTKS